MHHVPLTHDKLCLSLLGNSGKSVTLVTLSLTKFLRHAFQGQETHDFRKPGTCEAPNSRMYEVRESWSGEVIGSRTCGGPEPQAGGGTNFGGPSSEVTREDMHEPVKKRRPVRESVEDPVRKSRAKTCTNRWRSEGQFGNLSRTQFGSYAWRHSRTGGEAKSKLLSQKVRV
jgi:hypothetical protein